MTLETAKNHLTIPILWKRLGLPNEPARMCKSPWRDEKAPSLSVNRDGTLWYDFGMDKGGDAICFLQEALGISRKDACKQFLDMASGSESTGSVIQRETRIVHRPLPVIPQLREPTMAELMELRRLRGINISALYQAVLDGTLSFSEFEGSTVWIITDLKRINAQMRRLDGQPILGKKAKTITNSRARWPIGIMESGPRITLVEGGPDFLAAYQYRPDDSPVCMLGSFSISEEALPLFKGKHVTIIPHNDESGEVALTRRLKQLEPITQVSVERLPTKDLNDLLLKTTKS